MKTIEAKEIKGLWNEKFYSSQKDEVRIYIDNKEIHCKKSEIKEVDGYGQSWQATKSDICTKCGQKINIEQSVRYRYNGGKHLEHVDCEKAEKENKKQAEIEKTYINISNHYQKYSKNEVTYDWSTHRYLFVIACKSMYVDEADCMSFGRMTPGYIYDATCRLATKEEADTIREKIEQRKKEIEAEKAQKKIENEARTEMKSIIDNIRKQENLPDEKNITLDGERYCDSQNIYGGGGWFVITEKEIWYVQNNGMDGDDWSYNNIRTGGAGAIGWRITKTEKSVEQIKKIDTILYTNKIIMPEGK